MRMLLLTACLAATAGLFALAARAQEAATTTSETTTTTVQPGPAPTQAGGDPSAEDVLNELLRRRAENPLIEPARPAIDATSATTPSTAQPIGTAPGVEQTRLKREGQFIITRRARMVRSVGGGVTPWMLTFEADKDGLEDPPMFIMPCQMLEDMEKIAAERGEGVVFTVSGQVFVYRGANYILPTMMRMAPDMGNLRP